MSLWVTGYYNSPEATDTAGSASDFIKQTDTKQSLHTHHTDFFNELLKDK